MVAIVEASDLREAQSLPQCPPGKSEGKERDTVAATVINTGRKRMIPASMEGVADRAPLLVHFSLLDESTTMITHEYSDQADETRERHEPERTVYEHQARSAPPTT